jgi:hypothetical protein
MVHGVDGFTNELRYIVDVIPLFEDTLEKWGFLQVIMKVIGQESYWTTLHPLPTGRRKMGGQEKE